jgi:hypothetical protein
MSKSKIPLGQNKKVDEEKNPRGTLKEKEINNKFTRTYSDGDEKISNIYEIAAFSS